MKLEATATALAIQSATTATATVAVTNQWWFAVVAAAIGTLFAVNSEKAKEPGEVRKVVTRILMLTAFSWVVGEHFGGLPHVPFLVSVPNPVEHIPSWVRTGTVGLFSPYLHAICVAFLKKRMDGFGLANQDPP